MNEIGIIITGFVQLIFTGGIFIWLIRKISNFGERLSGIESVFEYMRADHDLTIKTDARQEKYEKDLNQCFDRIRSLENRSQH